MRLSFPQLVERVTRLDCTSPYIGRMKWPALPGMTGYGHLAPPMAETQPDVSSMVATRLRAAIRTRFDHIKTRYVAADSFRLHAVHGETRLVGYLCPCLWRAADYERASGWGRWARISSTRSTAWPRPAPARRGCLSASGVHGVMRVPYGSGEAGPTSTESFHHLDGAARQADTPISKYRSLIGGNGTPRPVALVRRV